MCIKNMTLAQQAHLMSVCSNLAYYNPTYSTKRFKEIGFNSKLISKHGSEAYVLSNSHDIIIAFRGTQPTHFNDIEHALDIELVPFYTGHVHAGFLDSVDNLWDLIIDDVQNLTPTQRLWCTGHSLGGAMALLFAVQLHQHPELPLTRSVFTFGCPRVGDRSFVNMISPIGITHYRFVNNVDIVTQLPCSPYKHYAPMIYMNHWGNIRELTYWQLVKDRIRGIIKGLMEGKINFFENHQIIRYSNNLAMWANGREKPQDKY